MGQLAVAVAVTPDGKHAYVPTAHFIEVYSDKSVTMIDTATN
ncbi:MAG TPA: hypothetical protein VIE69_10425 [Methylophilaceae bacterium]